MPQPTVSLKLDEQTKDRLHNLATRRRRTPHWLMREAIEQYLQREEHAAQMREDAVAAWREYELTGLHVTLEEADVWLAQIEAGEKVEPPLAHD